MEDLGAHFRQLIECRAIGDSADRVYDDYKTWLLLCSREPEFWIHRWQVANRADHESIFAELSTRFSGPALVVACFQCLQSLEGFLRAGGQRTGFESCFLEGLRKLGVSDWTGDPVVHGVLVPSWCVNGRCEDVLPIVAILIPQEKPLDANAPESVLALNFYASKSTEESMRQAREQMLSHLRAAMTFPALAKEFAQLYCSRSLALALGSRSKLRLDTFLESCSIGFILQGLQGRSNPVSGCPLPSVTEDSAFASFFLAILESLGRLQHQKGWRERRLQRLPASLATSLLGLNDRGKRLLFSCPTPNVSGGFPLPGGCEQKREATVAYARNMREVERPVELWIPPGTDPAGSPVLAANPGCVKVQEVASLPELLKTLGSVPPLRKHFAKYSAFLLVFAALLMALRSGPQFWNEVTDYYTDYPLPEYYLPECKYSHPPGESDWLSLALLTEVPHAFTVRLVGSRAWKNEEWPISSAKSRDGRRLLNNMMEGTGIELSGPVDGELQIVRRRKLPFFRQEEQIVRRDPLAAVASLVTSEKKK